MRIMSRHMLRYHEKGVIKAKRESRYLTATKPLMLIYWGFEETFSNYESHFVVRISRYILFS